MMRFISVSMAVLFSIRLIVSAFTFVATIFDKNPFFFFFFLLSDENKRKPETTVMVALVSLYHFGPLPPKLGILDQLFWTLLYMGLSSIYYGPELLVLVISGPDQLMKWVIVGKCALLFIRASLMQKATLFVIGV